MALYDELSRSMEFIDTRWRKISDNWPLPGTVFVGRNDNKIYPKLFLRTKNDTVYLKDTDTHMPCLSDFMTHWLPVGETDTTIL